MSWTTDLFDYTTVLTSDAQGRPQYIARAKPGTALSAASWQIKKLVYDSSGNPSVYWASGSHKFGFVATDPTIYSYS